MVAFNAVIAFTGMIALSGVTATVMANTVMSTAPFLDTSETEVATTVTVKSFGTGEVGAV